MRLPSPKKTALRLAGCALPALTLLLGSCSDSDSPANPGGADNVDSSPPAAVSDLSVSESGATSLLVSWTAVGDDSLSGTAAFYDLRYGAELLSEETWEEAQRAEGEPQPGPPGTPESMRVGGLEPGMAYWLSVRAVDSAGNVSPLGSVVEGATIPALATGFDIPLGLYWEEDRERLLVCDNGADAILSVSLDGAVTSLVEIPGPVTIRPWTPTQFAISSGQLDSPDGGLFRWGASADPDTVVSFADGFSQISGVIAGSDSVVFFAETLQGKVWRLETGGGAPRLHWQLEGVVGGLALDGEGNLYAALPSDGSIRVLTGETEDELVSPGALGIPLELLYDAKRDLLLVSDAGANTAGVYRVSLKGEIERVDGVSGPAGGLALDAEGNLFYSTLVSLTGEDQGAVAMIPSEKVGP